MSLRSLLLSRTTLPPKLEVIEQQAAEIRELREENAQLVQVNGELRELADRQAARLAGTPIP